MNKPQPKYDKLITREDFDEETLTAFERDELDEMTHGDEEYDRRRDELADERLREQEA